MHKLPVSKFVYISVISLITTMSVQLSIAQENKTITSEAHDYIIIKQSARAVKTALENLLNTEIETIGRLRGTLENVHLSGSPDEIVAQFSRSLNGKWWKRGNGYVLAINARPITRLTPKTVEEAYYLAELKDLGLLTGALSVEFGGQFIRLSGPEPLVDQAERIAISMTSHQLPLPDKQDNTILLIRGPVMEKIIPPAS